MIGLPEGMTFFRIGLTI